MSEHCAKCGSDRIVPDARVFDQGEWSDGVLKAAFDKDPSAWIFKGTMLNNLTARICGECGYTELYTQDAQAIYQAYQQTRLS